MNNQEITLEDIRRRKQQIRKQLRLRKIVMTQKAQTLFTAPKVVDTKWGKALNAMNTGWAILDGVMLGFRIMGRVRRFLHR